MAVATFAAGCFWGVEETFRKVPGVTATRVGYTGGHRDDPTYRQVCRGDTGHAEAVEVTFNPDQVTFDRLLQVFWGCHDPTQLNRQGPDIGTQYRSAIFVHDESQAEAARASKTREAESGRYARPIATEIVSAGPFWEAEDYHQKYVQKQRSCFGVEPF